MVIRGGLLESSFNYGNGAVMSMANDYTDANISTGSSASYQSVGGIVGEQTTGTITNVYATGTVDVASNSSTAAGGIAGRIGGGTTTNAFSAVAITGSATSQGAVYGTSGGASTNTYFDEYLAGLSACSGDAGISCTAENVSNSNPSYFYSSRNNGPFGPGTLTVHGQLPQPIRCCKIKHLSPLPQLFPITETLTTTAQLIHMSQTYLISLTLLGSGPMFLSLVAMVVC